MSVTVILVLVWALVITLGVIANEARLYSLKRRCEALEESVACYEDVLRAADSLLQFIVADIERIEKQLKKDKLSA